MELAKHYEIPFLETSAKNSINVETSFITMSNEIKRNIQNKANTGTATGDKKGIVFGRGISHQQNSGSDETADSSTGSVAKKKNSQCCQWDWEALPGQGWTNNYT